MRVSEFLSEEKALLLREMGLHTSSKGFKLNLLSNALHFRTMLEMLSALFKVGTPNHCLWQGDLGEELNLLATILEQSIVSFTNDNPENNAGRLFLDSNICPLYLSSVYDRYNRRIIYTYFTHCKPFQSSSAPAQL